MARKAGLRKVSAIGMAAIVLGTIVAACDNAERVPVLCGCVEKEQWDVCKCGTDEGKCDCAVIEYKTLTNGIRVYRSDAGVTGAQMDAAVMNVQNGWDGLDADDAEVMNGKVEKVVVVSGANGLEAAGEKWIVTVGATQDASAVTTTLKDYLDTQIDPLYACATMNPNGKNHLGIGENCDCDGRECDCGLQVYGYLGDAANTPIYRSGDVSDEQMAAAVANAQSAYNMLCAICPKLVKNLEKRLTKKSN
ncbi:MAG: hypothetical protein LBK73_04930 [Treponema sp.]|nr:hypothetical protein [Treponema sp.]